MSIVMSRMPDSLGSIPSRGKGLFFTVSRVALGSTHPTIEWEPGALSPGVK
jgi:hypothetical protein